MLNHDEIHPKILQSAMNLAAQRGWNHMTLVDAAHHCHLPLDLVREQFPCKSSLLLYLNRLADQAALKETYQQQPIPDYLFDLFMERFDIFQHYRQGFISALKTLPFNPPLALIMHFATQNSMKWMAQAAQINTNGLRGIGCIKGLTAIWVLNLKVWIKDESEDMAQTMASLDKTLKKAKPFASYFIKKTTVQENTTLPTPHTPFSEKKEK